MAGRTTIVAVRRSDRRDPELPAATDDVSDPPFAGLAGGALRASAHGISHVTVSRIGRRRSAVEHLNNTSGVEGSGLLLRPGHLAVRTRRGIYNEPRGDAGIEVARHID